MSGRSSIISSRNIRTALAPLEGGFDQFSRPRRVNVTSRRNRSGRSAKPFRASRRDAERAGGRLGIIKGGDGGVPVQEDSWSSVPADQHREHGLFRTGASDGVVNRSGHLICSGDDGRDEEDDQCVETPVLEQRRNDATRTSAPSPSRAGRPDWRGLRRRVAAVAARPAFPRPSSGSSSPAASQASAQRIPSPPAFVSTPTRRPAWQRLAREQRSRVDQLLERVRADHAGLAEERVDRRIRAGERCRVRARRPGAGRRRARLEREDRLAARDRAARAARTCADCRTTRGRAGRRSVSSSSSHHSSRSFEETSALLPIDTNAEKPRFRSERLLRAARDRARRSARRTRSARAAAARGPKVAFRPRRGTAMPRQFGPTSRPP